MSLQFHDSLINFMSMPSQDATDEQQLPWVRTVHPSYCPTFNKYLPCSSHILCEHELGEGRGLEVHFIPNDFLLRARRTFQQGGHHTVVSWMQHIRPLNTKVLVLNRGAHFVPDKKYTKGLTAVMEEIHENHPNTLVIYRSTTPGHVNCTQYDHPIDLPQDPASASKISLGRVRAAELVGEGDC
eukprot:TRINITY_DN3276_c0_g1_i2.p1 TRINITY_DN3276_c0_g1~~TRINITY_DN3276_c0_g1_i2.p1  ORF type:complete len:184 (-),score=34.21 TRINITY_DN3276_c0_g1_i2:276-827(-)